ncbi:hypothetical protein I6N95_04350 [Vagococcus sp. BWB3-3]|uniref:Alternate signal-mediated exported protein, CPF_0494 family n=1 Tax=Vagococcus allomyrinae TaxID=2794353 RepID=A0A940P875_9ENTE|nr:hypothetical protein [Vagococcus allomyrinae]MBP1040239.1 hypothetical protein [Vagococcus allomyrinae]
MAKKKRSRSKSKQKRTLKKGFMIFSIIYSLVIVIGSTYAWVTMADERINRVETNHVAIKVEGDQSNTVISPGTVAEKDITVRNISSSAGFVRVSLEEALLTFEIDVTDQMGNGNVKVYPTVAASEIKLKDLSTWVSGNTYKKANNQFFKADLSLQQAYDHEDPARNTTLFQYVELAFPEVFTSIQGGTDYWLYEDGYFYYSEFLKPNQQAEILVKSIKGSQATPNIFKQTFYGLEVQAEGYSLTETSLELMGLTSSDLAYQMLMSRLT